MIDRLIAKKLKRINDAQQNDKRNDILTTQDKLISVVGKKTEFARETAFTNIQDRHLEATKTIHSSIEYILQNSEAINMPLAENAEIVEEKDAVSENEDELNDLFTDLKNI